MNNISTKDDYDIVSILKNITTDDQFFNKMKGISVFERYPYLKDQLPTVPYIQDILVTPFTLEQYYDIGTGRTKNNRVYSETDSKIYTKWAQELSVYQPKEDRLISYPFNSNLYLDYIGQQNVGMKKENFSI